MSQTYFLMIFSFTISSLLFRTQYLIFLVDQSYLLVFLLSKPTYKHHHNIKSFGELLHRQDELETILGQSIKIYHSLFYIEFGWTNRIPSDRTNYWCEIYSYNFGQQFFFSFKGFRNGVTIKARMSTDLILIQMNYRWYSRKQESWELLIVKH